MPEENSEQGSHEVSRPLECGECKKPKAVCYTEAFGKTLNKTVMCNDCPVLKRKLHGHSSTGNGSKDPSSSVSTETNTSVCCGGCGLPREEVLVGAPVGCPLCYEIFDEEIFDQLAALDKIPSKNGHIRRNGSLHKGRRPAIAQEGDLSLQLVALQQALHETLGREDYEQAAWLRDQIKELTEKKSKKPSAGKKANGR